MAKKQYPQALRKLQQAQKRDPDQGFGITEADIWLQQGQYEYGRAQYAKAEDSFGQALALGLQEDAYYWLSKCYLADNKAAEALELFQSAFDSKTLPKDLGGSYLKLLLLNHQAEQVEDLVKTQAKRFYAPHLHWAKGALALQAGDPKAALTHFKKMGRPASPGDYPPAWEAYAHQTLEDWPAAGRLLGMPSPAFGGLGFPPMGPKHPAVQPLRMALATHSGRRLDDVCDLDQPDLPHRSAAWVLELLYLLRDDNFHDAAHVVLDFPKEVMGDYPELKTLYRPLMLLAGQQALQQQELSCTASFWGGVVDQPEFDPQLAVQLYPVLAAIEDVRAAQQLVNQLLSWVQKAAKRDSQAWPSERLNATQAKLYCWLADHQMSLGRYRDAERSVRKAEQLAPDHPEVIGRKGMQLFADDQKQAAIPLLTQALEAGCRFEEVYLALAECLQADKEALKSVRRKFGKHFGDTGVDTEVEIPAWVEALSFQYYEVMENFVNNHETPTPPLKALQIFLDSAQDGPSGSQKISLDLEAAVPQWDDLLRSHSPSEQVEILKAIYLVIQQHARRNQKGITAQQSRYAEQIFELIPTVPEANLAYLMLLPLKNPSTKRLDVAVTAALRRSPQPGNLLAQAQLQLSWFGHNRVLAPLIEEQLRQEPQNPLLLLAKATLYPRSSLEYTTFYDQGFELARRLQDAIALQACREEEWFKAQDMTRRAVGSQMGAIGDLGQINMIDIIQRMAQEAFGTAVPPELIAQMLPELEAKMGSRFDPFDDDFEDDEDDEDDDVPPFFLPPSGRGKSSGKKRKPWYKL
ncbi:tetratricopeptide repeat protein [Nodosilinea nodulosa]|uniref:tetratricopeptide repeat protein n=1 Tax=Nodosilinea nodulosa TaxID=416001 RepID=UPI0003803B0B|nr:tetratricopeptide repeat protein [Nodosilinea nodulosa]